MATQQPKKKYSRPADIENFLEEQRKIEQQYKEEARSGAIRELSGWGRGIKQAITGTIETAGALARDPFAPFRYAKQAAESPGAFAQDVAAGLSNLPAAIGNLASTPEGRGQLAIGVATLPRKLLEKTLSKSVAESIKKVPLKRTAAAATVAGATAAQQEEEAYRRAKEQGATEEQAKEVGKEAGRSTYGQTVGMSSVPLLAERTVKATRTAAGIVTGDIPERVAADIRRTVPALIGGKSRETAGVSQETKDAAVSGARREFESATGRSVDELEVALTTAKGAEKQRLQTLLNQAREREASALKDAEPISVKRDVYRRGQLLQNVVRKARERRYEKLKVGNRKKSFDDFAKDARNEGVGAAGASPEYDALLNYIDDQLKVEKVGAGRFARKVSEEERAALKSLRDDLEKDAYEIVQDPVTGARKRVKAGKSRLDWDAIDKTRRLILEKKSPGAERYAAIRSGRAADLASKLMAIQDDITPGIADLSKRYAIGQTDLRATFGADLDRAFKVVKGTKDIYRQTPEQALSSFVTKTRSAARALKNSADSDAALRNIGRIVQEELLSRAKDKPLKEVINEHADFLSEFPDVAARLRESAEKQGAALGRAQSAERVVSERGKALSAVESTNAIDLVKSLFEGKQSIRNAEMVGRTLKQNPDLIPVYRDAFGVFLSDLPTGQAAERIGKYKLNLKGLGYSTGEIDRIVSAAQKLDEANSLTLLKSRADLGEVELSRAQYDEIARRSKELGRESTAAAVMLALGGSGYLLVSGTAGAAMATGMAAVGAAAGRELLGKAAQRRAFANIESALKKQLGSPEFAAHLDSKPTVGRVRAQLRKVGIDLSLDAVQRSLAAQGVLLPITAQDREEEFGGL